MHNLDFESLTMPHRVQSLIAEKEWASILEKNQVLERGNLAKEKSPKDILVFRLQWHGWSAYKTAGNKMDIQLQCSSKSKEREKDEHLKFWLAGKEEARDGRPLPLCSLDYGCLGNRVMPQWHTLRLFRPISWTFFRLTLCLQLAADCHSRPHWNCSISCMQVKSSL